MTRGGFSITAAGAALAALLAGPSEAEGSGKRTVVLTGASSGIGLDAATKLVRQKRFTAQVDSVERASGPHPLVYLGS